MRHTNLEIFCKVRKILRGRTTVRPWLSETLHVTYGEGGGRRGGWWTFSQNLAPQLLRCGCNDVFFRFAEKQLVWHNSKTQKFTKLKKLKYWQYSNEPNCHKTTKKGVIKKELRKFKIQQNFTKIYDKTQELIVRKFNSNCDRTKKVKLCQKTKTWIVTELKNWNCDKTKKIRLWEIKMQLNFLQN